jgi:hypothetical protein
MYNAGKIKFRVVISILLLNFCGQSQNKTVFAKYYVKQNNILLRWVPSDKTVFDLAVKNGYKITRYTKENNTLTSPAVITENLKPYPQQDTLKWARLIQLSDGGIIAYKILCNPPPAGLATPAQIRNEKMYYGLLLLSCDLNNGIAKATGLFLKDSSITNNRVYSYKIEINSAPATLKYVPAVIDVNASKLSSNSSIKGLTGTFRNKDVKLRWRSVDYKNDYSAYNIERSSDSIHYEKINLSPVILLSSQFEKKKDFITYYDTFPKLKVKYYYRIKGINHFGEEGEPSNIVSGTGYEPLSSFPIIDSIKTVANQKVFIQFRMQDKKENLLPREYILVRAKKDKGPYEKIFSSKNPASYIDEKPESTNYYKAGVISYGGDTLYSYSYLALIADTIPPVSPSGLKAKVDVKGNVTLTWAKNPEADVQGYKILKSNALHEEFVQINNEFAREPIYKDKLNLKTLTRHIYYSVVATDKRYNNSTKCTPIEVKRPDTIAPVKPILTNLDLNNNGVNVNWINSNSEDVKYYVLYRSSEPLMKEIKIKEWLAKDSLKQFLDTTVEMGVGYKYRLLVSDEEDNFSVSNNPYIKFETGYRKKITDIKFEVDRTIKTIKLKWNYNAGSIEKFVLYRCKQGGQLTIIKTLPGKTSEFTDATPNMGNIYEYRIKPVFANGAEGIISDPIIIEY